LEGPGFVLNTVGDGIAFPQPFTRIPPALWQGSNRLRMAALEAESDREADSPSESRAQAKITSF